MGGEGHRILRECGRRSQELRTKGFTFDQIVQVLALDHRVSPLRLYRYAHGYTARAVCDAFNQLDPAASAGLREARLYDYEAWPEAGRRPPAWALKILARIYRTRASMLITEAVYSTYRPKDQDIIDRADHRPLDTTRRSSAAVSTIRPSRGSMEPGATASSSGILRDRAVLEARDCENLFHAVCAQEADVKRRDVLFQLALALGGTAALPLVRHLTPEESERLAYAIRTPGGIDAPSIAAIEKLTAHCRRLDDTVGPSAALPVADAQRGLLADLLRRETLTPALRDRLTTAYAQLCQLTGYLHYDLMDYAGATHRFNEGLEAALEVGDATLLGYIHHWLSDMASFHGQPAAALDHAFAAQGWARRSPSHLLRARTAFAQAWALALDGSRSMSTRLLDTARSEARRPGPADPSYLYWVKESHALEGSACFCFNDLKLPDASITTVRAQLDVCGAAYSRERAFGITHFAEALVQKREIAAATAKLAEAASASRRHSSARLDHVIRQVRDHLEPWSTTKYVRDLDDQLITAGFTIAPAEARDARRYLQ